LVDRWSTVFPIEAIMAPAVLSGAVAESTKTVTCGDNPRLAIATSSAGN